MAWPQDFDVAGSHKGIFWIHESTNLGQHLHILFDTFFLQDKT
jgi:hypothetical protein